MLKAQIHWKGTSGVAVECEFAYPLKEGDTFIVVEDTERYLCKVDTIVHFPVNADPETPPRSGIS